MEGPRAMAGGTTRNKRKGSGRVSSEILDRVPPHSLDAEKAVLGSILLAPHVCDDVVLIVRPDDFYLDAHQKLFEHMVGMHESGSRIDTTLLVERLKQAGDFEAVGGAAYLAEVLQSVAVPSHAAYYARIVRDKSTLRHLIGASCDILRDAYDAGQDPAELLSQAEAKVFAVRDRRSNDQITSMHDVLIEAFAVIDRRLEEGGSPGIPTGFTDLDRLTGGLHDSELIILAARPSMGKTALALNIAEHVSMESGLACLFVSLEMSRVELAQRVLCSVARINGNKFRNGFVTPKEREKLVRVSNRLSSAPLYIDDTPSRNISEIAACARRLKRKADLRLVIVDYLQLIEPDNSQDSRQEQVARMARRLKAMARELRMPVICLAQLNRQVDEGKHGHRPRLSHLRESGAIEQDADVVLFVHREEYYCRSHEEAVEKDLVGKAEVIVAKQRNGPTGDVKLAWFKQFTRFENLRDRHEEFDGHGEFEAVESFDSSDPNAAPF